MMSREYQTALLEYLLSFLQPERAALFQQKILQRSKYITIVLEDVFQSHNVSAVVRSCECFGIQDVHIIENNYAYTLSQNVAMGASKWLYLHHYSGEHFNSPTCLQELVQQGYTIVATTPSSGGYSLQDLPLDKPVALWFGTELKGLSDFAKENANIQMHIPMFGFTESLNLSVSAAISMYVLSTRLRNENHAWNLQEDEKLIVMLDWARKAVKRSELLELEFNRRYLSKD